MSNVTLGEFNRLLKGRSGVVTLNGATNVQVNTAFVTADSQVIFTLKTLGGTQGAAPVVKSLTVGSNFNVAGTAGDTSVYKWTILM